MSSFLDYLDKKMTEKKVSVCVENAIKVVNVDKKENFITENKVSILPKKDDSVAVAKLILSGISDDDEYGDQFFKKSNVINDDIKMASMIL